MRALWVGLVSAVAQLVLWTTPAVGRGMTEPFIVSVPGGRVQGTLRSGVVQFVDIPYGTAHRFHYPSPSVTAWSGIANASQPSIQCPQSCPPVIRDLYCLPDDQKSESCLTLNIFRPAYNLPADQAFPVMVFIHGGGFQSGSGGAPLYTGDYLARVGGVILVTINYRLGAFGFLPIFNSYDDVIGNFGFRDQQVALRWVKNNIAQFDGDPNKVTLVGEEAGCQSVGLHLTSFNSDPLFQAAIMHSCPFTIPFRSKTESHTMAADFAKALGCLENDVTCLREKSVEAILQAQRKVSNNVSSRSTSLRDFQVWGPTVDKSNVYYTTLLEELTKANMVNAKPIMIGYVSDEGTSSVYRKFPLPVSNNYFERLIRSIFPDKWGVIAGTVQAPYHSNLADARTQIVAFLNDFVYKCPAHKFANEVEKSFLGRSPKLWVYKFDPKVMWSPGGSAWPPGGETYCQKDVCQGLDLLYLFNPPTIPKARRARTAGLTRAMMLYWTNFVKHHNPNGLQESSASSRRGQTAQGSLLLSREVGFVSPLRPASVGPPLPGTFHLPPSLDRLLHVASISPYPAFSPPILYPPPPQPQHAFGVPLVLQNSLHRGGNTVGSLLAQTRQASSTRTAPRFVDWPSYVTQHPVTSSDVNATLVLTQPKAHAQYFPFDEGCEFWEGVGFR